MSDTAEQAAAARFAEGEAAFEQKDFRRALDIFADVVLLPGTSGDKVPALRWNMAICQAHLGHFDTALQQVAAAGMDEAEFRELLASQGVTGDPTEDEARRLFADATTCVATNQPSKALDLFTELMVHPGVPADAMPAIQWNMALCFAHLGDWDTALGHLQASGYDEAGFRAEVAKQGISDDPNQAEARRLFYDAQQTVGDGRHEEALDAFADLMLHPGIEASAMATMHWNMAVCLAHLGRWDTAFEHIDAGDLGRGDFEAEMELQGLHPPERS